MEAIDTFEEFQTTDSSMDVLPSLNVPVAVNCWTAPGAIEMVPGVTAIDCSPAGVYVLG